MTPLALTTCAVLAAVAAAAIGHRYSPTQRARRRAQREQAFAAEMRALNLRRARLEVAGLLASSPNAWATFWASHQLDDVLRGGS